MEPMAVEATRTHQASVRAPRLGDRVRQLRVAAGMTQTDLAAERFSKEYISQIERGKTRPTSETVEWLAARLGVDATFLASGVSTDDRARAEAFLARAEALVQKLEFGEAVDEYSRALSPVVSSGSVELQVRFLSGEAWARMHNGDVRAGIDLLARARALVESPAFSDTDRAEVVFRLGVGRYLISSIATAVSLLGEALALIDRSPLPSDLLRASILTWRARCYRRQRDYEAAREDIESALELAEGDRGSAHPRRGVPPGLARRRARRSLGSRAHLRGARQGAIRGGVRSRQRRAAAQQPRRPRVPPRQAREGDHASERGVRRRPRPRHRGRRGDGGLVARTGVLEDRRSGWGREPGA